MDTDCKSARSGVKGTVDTDDEVLAKHKSLVRIIKANPSLSLRDLSKLSVDNDKRYKASPNTVKKVKEIFDNMKRLSIKIALFVLKYDYGLYPIFSLTFLL
jgi:uncharacterized protein with von Willebrand factor type A (vWA) domain